MKLSLLRQPCLERDGKLVEINRRKAMALLAYLAITEKSHSRETLAALLWPETNPSQARLGLRQALWDLNRILGKDCLETLGETIALNFNGSLEVDVKNFYHLLEDCRTHGHSPNDICDACVPILVEAADLYQDEFMAGFSLPDCPSFDEWQFFEAENLRRALNIIIEKLVKLSIDREDFETAISYARRWAMLDSQAEEPHRALMRLYTWTDQRSAALRQYALCTRILAEEWSIAPSEETTLLYEAIKENRIPTPFYAGGRFGSGEIPQPGVLAGGRLPPCPYRGLFAFREVDAPYFFGREDYTRQVVEAAGSNSMLAIIGPSGSGKSSLVYAGLLSQLRQDPAWAMADLRPGSHPFQAMAGALLPLLKEGLDEIERLREIHELADALQQGKLPEIVEQVLQKDTHRSRLLLLVDQFEELYTLCWEAGLRSQFLEALLEAVSRPGLPFTLVLTMRADFMEQALAHRHFAEALPNSSLMLRPMTRQELARAIRTPAEKEGLSFETGLVERILDEVGEEPGNLPLLEFALTSLWERQSGGKLTHAAYDASGRVKGALMRYADDVFISLPPLEQQAAQRLFVQLVRPGERTEDTRRQAIRAELGEEEWALAQRLADARLVVTNRGPIGKETVEVVHEALIRNWERLRVWMETDRTFRIWQERLRAALRQWDTSGHDEQALLQGLSLGEAERWLRERERSLSQAEQAYIQNSLATQGRRQAEREHDRTTRERQRMGLIVGLAVGLVLVLTMALFAGVQWQEARQARNQALAAQATALAERNRIQVAFSRQIAAQALAQLYNRLDLALLLSVKAFQISPTTEARNSLDTAIRANPRLTAYLRGHTGGVRSLAISPDGLLLASGGDDKTIQLWDVRSRRTLGLPLTGHTSSVVSLAFSPNGRLLASSSNSRVIYLWDMVSGKPALAPLEGHTSSVRSVAFSPDGQLLASASDDGTIRLWEVSTGSQVGAPLVGHTAGVRSVAFSPDGKILASGGDDRQIILWNVRTRSLIYPTWRKDTPLSHGLSGHQDWVREVLFSPDGKTLASGSADGTIILWDVERFQPRLSPLVGHTASVLSLAFSPDGSLLASGGDDRTIILWEVATGQPYRPAIPTAGNTAQHANPAVPEGLAEAPLLSPSLPFRDITTGQPSDSLLIGHLAGVDSLVFSPDGETLFSGSGDGAIIPWDITPDTPPRPLIDRISAHAEGISGLAFSPDGKTLASSSWDRLIHLWDMQTRYLLPPSLEGHSASTLCVAFSPDGQTLASCGMEGSLRLWNLETRRTTGPLLTGHTALVRSAAFSADGKILASGSNDGTIRLWEVSTGRNTAILTGHTSGVFSVAFSPKARILASGSDDQTVRLWDAVTNQPLYPPLEGHTERVRSVAFNPDGSLLASGSDDGTLRLWQVSTGQPVGEPMTGHTSYVLSVTFSPDGSLLASGSADGKIWLWDVANGQPVGTPLAGHRGMVRSVAFSPLNNILASAGEDGMIFLWDTGMNTQAAFACRRASRNLTVEEWQFYFGSEPYEMICPEQP